MTPLHDQQRGYRFRGALALDRLIEGEASSRPSWWPQRDLPPGEPTPAVPFERHCVPDLGHLTAIRSRRGVYGELQAWVEYPCLRSATR